MAASEVQKTTNDMSYFDSYLALFFGGHFGSGLQGGPFFRTNPISPLDFGELFHGSALTSSCGGFGRGGARLGPHGAMVGAGVVGKSPRKKRTAKIPPKKEGVSENHDF